MRYLLLAIALVFVLAATQDAQAQVVVTDCHWNYQYPTTCVYPSSACVYPAPIYVSPPAVICYPQTTWQYRERVIVQGYWVPQTSYNCYPVYGW